jgi:hypothetical protein
MDLERSPLSLVSVTEELIEWKSSGFRSRKPRLTVMEICCADHSAPSIRRICTNFADNRRSLGRNSSLTEFFNNASVSTLQLYRVDDAMTDDCGAVGGLRIDRRQKYLENTRLSDACPPQIPHYLI